MHLGNTSNPRFAARPGLPTAAPGAGAVGAPLALALALLRPAVVTLVERRRESAARVLELIVRLNPKEEGARQMLERLREGDRR